MDGQNDVDILFLLRAVLHELGARSMDRLADSAFRDAFRDAPGRDRREVGA